MMRQLWPMAGLLLSLFPGSLASRCATRVAGEDTIVPDPTVQAQIDRTVQAYLVSHSEVSAKYAHKALDEQLKLYALAKNDTVLVRQLLYYAMHPLSDSGAIMVSWVFAEAHISDREMLEAVLPYIETSDRILRRKVLDCLNVVEGAPPLGHPPNYETYYEYLRGRTNSPPLALIEYMYRKAPGEALRTCETVFGDIREDRRNIVWAEHVVADVLWKQENGFLKRDEITADAVEQLDQLARCDHWWVRLYVAEILRSQPEFRTGAGVARLAQDVHPSVRKTIEQGIEKATKADNLQPRQEL